ncbi:hypothetical protein G9272_01065 [Streptomyces asoensis]|uniref:Uncharacterized protein n=1 Tax=Streptomyces asoensis TaxID=249586 RepID=A0A6M4WMK7_9ACTN|nr:hypothetical protein [Streptomyces asoensis]QJS99095.1 hypothetical protein G9272_01065 [Streptomyces asoensis]
MSDSWAAVEAVVASSGRGAGHSPMSRNGGPCHRVVRGGFGGATAPPPPSATESHLVATLTLHAQGLAPVDEVWSRYVAPPR